ncbi:MAG: hypothetical protein FDZ70_07220 [Actinobacteria bacterium]|nr:MAG: hypothetical protein FDZ70_07220 [Actinomycetota bacterium]
MTLPPLLPIVVVWLAGFAAGAALFAGHPRDERVSTAQKRGPSIRTRRRVGAKAHIFRTALFCCAYAAIGGGAVAAGLGIQGRILASTGYSGVEWPLAALLLCFSLLVVVSEVQKRMADAEGPFQGADGLVDDQNRESDDY